MPAETRRLLKLWSEARASGQHCALATVVRVTGSSYRKPGARMLITSDGQRCGTVSGGCLEGEVSRKIWWLTAQGSAVRDYATAYDDDSQSYGLGCDGVVTLLLERPSQSDPVFEALQRSVEDRVPAAIVTVIDTDAGELMGERLVLTEGFDTNRSNGHRADLRQQLLPLARKTIQSRRSGPGLMLFEGRSFELFAEYLSPPPALFIFGAGDDAQPLVRLAYFMGWEITVADGRSNLATAVRFPLAHRVVIWESGPVFNQLAIRPGDSAVVLTHSYAQDLSILRSLLPLRLGYLGVLGPRRRTERIVGEVAPLVGTDPSTALGSLRSPVGLDLGTGSPEVIALSIVAEMQAALAQRSAAPLNLAASMAATIDG